MYRYIDLAPRTKQAVPKHFFLSTLPPPCVGLFVYFVLLTGLVYTGVYDCHILHASYFMTVHVVSKYLNFNINFCLLGNCTAVLPVV